jgi:hypothetical protein
MTPIDPQRMADITARFFLQAADDPALASRLSLANTTVHVHYTDEVGTTVMLDSDPIRAEAQIVGTAEVELWGDPELFMAFVQREKHMAMAIADGELRYAGPVRKFLRIVPILRALDFDVWSDVRPN